MKGEGAGVEVEAGGSERGVREERGGDCERKRGREEGGRGGGTLVGARSVHQTAASGERWGGRRARSEGVPKGGGVASGEETSCDSEGCDLKGGRGRASAAAAVVAAWTAGAYATQGPRCRCVFVSPSLHKDLRCFPEPGCSALAT